VSHTGSGKRADITSTLTYNYTTHHTIIHPSTPLSLKTLDYNYESWLLGMFPSSHPELFASYLNTLLQWMGPAATMAQEMCKKFNATCPPTALYFPCHLAPWGYQSQDTTIYQHWNLAYALLPLVTQWTFTHNLTAARLALPLFEGTTDLLSSILQKLPSNATPAGYAYHDANPLNLDSAGEGPGVPNPQIALSYFASVAAAHADMAAALSVPYPPQAMDIALNMAPYPTYLRPVHNASPSAPPNATVWALWDTSDTSRAPPLGGPMPIYVGEDLGGLLPISPQQRAIAQATVRSGIAGDWAATGTLFSPVAAVLLSSGCPGKCNSTAFPYAFSPEEVIAGWLSSITQDPSQNTQGFLGRNGLILALAGIENIGASRFVTELLLGSGLLTPAPKASWYARLFPVWPMAQPAAFSGLLSKGGFAWSANYTANVGVSSPVGVTAQYASGACAALNPWPELGRSGVTVTCGGGTPTLTWIDVDEGEVFQWSMTMGQQCTVSANK